MNPSMSIIKIRTSLVYKQMDALSLSTDELASAIGLSNQALITILSLGKCTVITAGRLSKILDIHLWELIR